MDALIDRIFSKLSEHFPQDPLPANTDLPERSLRALRLITRLKTATVAAKSYGLFETIMQSTVTKAKKMEAARLALYPSYRRKLFLPVRDPEHIHNFLHYCNNLRTEKGNHPTSVMPEADLAPNIPTWQYKTEPIGNANRTSAGFRLPKPEELDWWGGILSSVGDCDEGEGRGRLKAVQNPNQGESGLGSSVGLPIS